MWHFIQNETQQGPFSPEQMAQYIANGTVTAQTMVWCEGMPEWQEAANTPLAAHFTQSKPAVVPVATVVEDPVIKAKTRKMNFWALSGLGWMFGACLIAIGMQNSSLLKATSGKPNRMPLTELIKKGPGSNAYVELTHLQFGERIWIEKDRNSGSWTGAWAFLFSEKDLKNPLAVAHIDGGGEKTMSQWMSQTTLRGLADERPKFFNSYTADQLYKMYPNVKSRDLKWYIEVVNKRPNEGRIKLAYGSGIFLIIGGPVLAFILYGKRKRAK